MLPVFVWFVVLSLPSISVLASQVPDSIHHAGLVVRHGDGRLTYVYLAFEEEEIGGIELLRRSGLEQVTIPFGGLGEGVCQIEGEGCPASECRLRVCQAPGSDSPYWRYFGLDESGAWVPFALGVSSTKVRDGDVHGWSWTPDEPGLPTVTIDDVVRLAGAPTGPDADAEAGGAVFVRTVYPPGVEPTEEDDGAGLLTYVAAGGALLLIGGGTIVAFRRGRPRADRPEVAA